MKHIAKNTNSTTDHGTNNYSNHPQTGNKLSALLSALGLTILGILGFCLKKSKKHPQLRMLNLLFILSFETSVEQWTNWVIVMNTFDSFPDEWSD